MHYRITIHSTDDQIVSGATFTVIAESADEAWRQFVKAHPEYPREAVWVSKWSEEDLIIGAGPKPAQGD